MSRTERLLLASVLALGLWLRVYGLAFGMPILSNLYIRPDESLIAASAAEIFETAGKPGTFAYPALMQELAAVVYHAGFAAGRTVGWITAPTLRLHFGADPTIYYMVLRWISALCGAATVWVVLLLARRLAGTRPALASAALMATAPLAVRDSHFGVTDTPYVLLCSLVLLFVFRYLDAPQEREARELRAAYLLLVAAIATKYAALLMVPVVVGAVAAKCSRSGRGVPWRRIVLLCLAGLGVFFLLNPYLLLMHERAWRELRYILTALYLWQPGDPPWNPGAALLQIGRPLRNGPGGWLTVPLLAAGLVSTIRAIRRGDGLHSLLVAQAALSTFAVLLPFQHTVPYRYLLPALPWIAVLAALPLRVLAARPALLTAASCALIAAPAWQSWRMDSLLAAPDTRQLAWDWISTHVPPSVPVLWAGGPECEPHFRESVASIERRIDWVHKRYGPFSGNIVSQPYRMMAEARSLDPAGTYEIHRNPDSGQIPAREFLFVTPEYPLAMARVKYDLPPGGFRVLREQRIAGLVEPERELELDRIDAFFLPFRPLDAVLRPGPAIRLRWIRYADESD